MSWGRPPPPPKPPTKNPKNPPPTHQRPVSPTGVGNRGDVMRQPLRTLSVVLWKQVSGTFSTYFPPEIWTSEPQDTES